MKKLSKDWKEKRIKFNPTIRQIFVLNKAYKNNKMILEFLDRMDLGKYIIKKLDKTIDSKQWKELNEEWKALKIEWEKEHHKEKVSRTETTEKENIRSWSSE